MYGMVTLQSLPVSASLCSLLGLGRIGLKKRSLLRFQSNSTFTSDGYKQNLEIISGINLILKICPKFQVLTSLFSGVDELCDEH